MVTRSYSLIKTSLFENTNVKSERGRLWTFDNRTYAEYGSIPPSLFAAAGFYYVGRTDEVCCCYCNVQLCNWEEGDSPKVTHAIFSNDCAQTQAKNEKKCNNLKMNCKLNYYGYKEVNMTLKEPDLKFHDKINKSISFPIINVPFVIEQLAFLYTSTGGNLDDNKIDKAIRDGNEKYRTDLKKLTKWWNDRDIEKMSNEMIARREKRSSDYILCMLDKGLEREEMLEKKRRKIERLNKKKKANVINNDSSVVDNLDT